MFTPTRAALMGKTSADLVHMLRLMGADAQAGEAKESLVSRILLFQRQEWKPEPPKQRPVIKPLTEKQLQEELKPFLKRGLKLRVVAGVDGSGGSASSSAGTWHISITLPGYGAAKSVKRQDSGSLCMPLDAVVRCCEYLMPERV